MLAMFFYYLGLLTQKINEFPGLIVELYCVKFGDAGNFQVQH